MSHHTTVVATSPGGDNVLATCSCGWSTEELYDPDARWVASTRARMAVIDHLEGVIRTMEDVIRTMSRC